MGARLLITGAAGFIGSHVVEHFLKNTEYELILVDKLAYAANGMARLREVKAFQESGKRVQMFAIDVSAPISAGIVQEIGSVDYILHLAAETHVDRSISDPRPFVISNVLGTMEMLEFARKISRLKMFICFGTDEEFGPCNVGAPAWKENSRFNPTNPYSATKCGADALALAWANTYGLPVINTKCMNVFGERQHPEKFIPMTVKKLLRSERLTIHSDPQKTKAGSRSYIHARNVAAAIQYIMENAKLDFTGRMRDKYNIVGEKEVDNLTLADTIHAIMQEKMPGRVLDFKHEMVDFHSSRPGHDLRYALDGKKLKDMGWEPPKTFDDSLRRTVEWMIQPENMGWLLLD